MKIIYIDMCADLLHYGHVRFIRNAKSLGDKLIVGLHSDETMESYKRKPILTFNERKEVLEAIKYIDEIIDNAPLNPGKDYFDRLNIDLMVIPDNCNNNTIQKLYKYPFDNNMLKVVNYTKEISTTLIIDRILNKKN